MEILMILGEIPLMFYLSIAIFPTALWGYFSVSKPKKTITAKDADPAEQLKGKKISAKRELRSAALLSAVVACGVAIIISLGQIIDDYKNDEGLFAKILSATSLPPSPEAVLPPAPPMIEIKN